MVDLDRRNVFVAGLAASLISNTTASAQQAAAVSPEGIVKANEYRPFSGSKLAARCDNS
jgi:hypothetical protein